MLEIILDDEEVYTAPRSTNDAGYDGIHTKVSKEAAIYLLRPLPRLHNWGLKEGVFPQCSNQQFITTTKDRRSPRFESISTNLHTFNFLKGVSRSVSIKNYETMLRS